MPEHIKAKLAEEIKALEYDVVTVVTPNGKRELEVLKLATIHDVAEEKAEAAKA